MTASPGTTTVVSISEGARLVGRDRTTLNRDARKGKLSKTRQGDGSPGVEISELIRVYGPLTGSPDEKPEEGRAPEYAEAEAPEARRAALAARVRPTLEPELLAELARSGEINVGLVDVVRRQEELLAAAGDREADLLRQLERLTTHLLPAPATEAERMASKRRRWRLFGGR